MRNILISLIGTSPAVLTETVWALATHPTEPIIPDVIIVLTTIRGAEMTRQQLFGPDQLWETLRKQILGADYAASKDSRLDFADSPSRLKVFEQRLPDGARRQLERMDTVDETQAAGDCIVEEVWGWVSRPGHRVLASLSGGFKTMSALLYATMTAIGRLEDRALHVLVENPYDGGTAPMFYWPEQPVQELKAKYPGSRHDGTLYKANDLFLAADAATKLVLTEVPFPSLTRLFGKYGFDHSPTFSDLIERCRNATEAPAISDESNDDDSDNGGEPEITSLELINSSLTVHINETELTLGPVSFHLLRFLALAARHGPVIHDSKHATKGFHAFLEAHLKADQHHYGKLNTHRNSLAAELDKLAGQPDFKVHRYDAAMNALKGDLRAAGRNGELLVRALPRGSRKMLQISKAAIKAK